MKKILFLSGTRADFGKIKPLIEAVADCKKFDWMIFVTGMHMLSRYGFTVDEVYKAGFRNIYTFMNQGHGEPMEQVLANTITGLSRYVQEYNPDLIIIHGDRIEAMAGAVVGSLRDIPVAHIEGGEISGTIDEIIRHSTSKLAHIHFVANDTAAARLKQMGEEPDSIYVIGSPDIDVMLSSGLPDINIVKAYYGIAFNEFAIAIYHPVTSENKKLRKNVNEYVDAMISSGFNYVVIFPNNDPGSDEIFTAYERCKNNSRFSLFPSLRFEYFLTLLKYARFIIGNSSAGIREAPVYAVPTVNIGSRQKNRSGADSIINVHNNKEDILKGIQNALHMEELHPTNEFGDGKSVEKFMQMLLSGSLFKVATQKHFRDYNDYAGGQ